MTNDAQPSAPARLLLCSAGLGALGTWLEDNLGARRSVAFVDAAARSSGSPRIITDCRDALMANGCTVNLVDLTRTDHDRMSDSLDDADAVFVTGGYPVYLLEWARSSGFLGYVADAVRAGSLGYIGVSAGAALAGPSMEPLAFPDDPGCVTDYAGLGLVDFVVLPHVNRRSAEEVEARLSKWRGRLQLRPLTDNRALMVSGSDIREVDSM